MIRCIIIILFSCCYALTGSAEELWLDTVKTLSGSFVQKTSRTGEARAWRGRFFLEPPYHVRWINEVPLRQEIVVDGETLWVYDLALGNVVRYSLDYYETSPIPLLFSAKKREEYFNIKCIYSSRRATHWEFIPKSPDSDYTSILLVIENKMIKRLDIYDYAGHRVELTFSEMILNQSIPPRNFIFTMPEGVELIDARIQDKL